MPHLLTSVKYHYLFIPVKSSIVWILLGIISVCKLNFVTFRNKYLRKTIIFRILWDLTVSMRLCVATIKPLSLSLVRNIPFHITVSFLDHWSPSAVCLQQCLCLLSLVWFSDISLDSLFTWCSLSTLTVSIPSAKLFGIQRKLNYQLLIFQVKVTTRISQT